MKYTRFITLIFLSISLILLTKISFLEDSLASHSLFSYGLGRHHPGVLISPHHSTRESDLPSLANLSSNQDIHPVMPGNTRVAEASAGDQTGENSSSLPQFLQGQSAVVLGIIASLVAGLATGFGAIPILFTPKVSDRLQGTLLGFSAGVMLAATSFSLLIPSIERVTGSGGSQVYAALVAVGGLVLGSGFIWVTDRHLPYERFIDGPNVPNYNKLKGIWLFIVAIAIHNFPEGLAVGVGFGGDNVGNGLALAIGIGLQNIPEGLAVAVALGTQNYARWTAFWIALATGLVEPIGGLLGVGIITLGSALLPWGLAFAAGAMLFVIGDEVIPEAQRLESEKIATVGIVIGFIIMMFLDVALG
jgi:ZIP family zinc transporter